MSTREEYDDLRRPHLVKAGLHPTAVNLILDLERTSDHIVIATVRQLEKTAAWKGRIVTIARTGVRLCYDGHAWRLAPMS